METDTLIASSLSASWNLQFLTFTTSAYFLLGTVLLLFIVSALIRGSENAFFLLNDADRKRSEKNNEINKLISGNNGNPQKLLAAVLVADSFIKAAIVIFSAGLLSELVVFTNFHAFEFVIQFALIFFFILLFTEILPSILAGKFKMFFIRIMAFPLNLMIKLCSPVSRLLISHTKIVNRRLLKHGSNFSIEISNALKLTSEQHLTNEKDILEGIVKFGNKNVSEIMKPRTDVVSLDFKTSFTDVMKLIIESGFSRIPVYSGSFDNIKGTLYIKDILSHRSKTDSFKWQTLIRPPFFVPETKKINSLLKEFQKNKVHLALVIDEYGGTSGIVTLEDVLEEIVGEIVDESDEEEQLHTQLAENVFLFDGKTLLGDFFRIVKYDDTVFNAIKGDAETLAGVILEIRGEIPALHEKIEYNDFVFTVEAVDNRRIKQIKVEIETNDSETKTGRINGQNQ